MKVLKWALITWAACATLLIVLVLISTKKHLTHTSTFCAYGRVFVEFEEQGRRWGTIMLDYDGRPIRCHEDDIEEIPVNTKEII